MPKDKDKRNDGEEFTLEEILAEVAGWDTPEAEAPPPELPVDPQPPPAPPPEPGGRRGRVVTFPRRGGAPPEPEEEPDPQPPPKKRGPRAALQLEILNRQEKEDEDEEELDPPEEDPDWLKEAMWAEAAKRQAEELPPKPPPEKVITFPSEPEESPLSKGLRKLKKKADDYAEQMFEEEGSEASPEVLRAERFIPGVDWEEPEEEEPPRRKRRKPPPAPDLPALELFRRYGKGLALCKVRTVFVFLLCLPLLYLGLAPAFDLPLPELLAGEYARGIYVQAVLLCGAMLLGVDAVSQGLLHLLTLRVELDSLMALSCGAALADALLLARTPGAERMPYCGVAALSLAFSLSGNYLKRKGSRIACRTAASAAEPDLITLDENKWNNKDAYAKWPGEPMGFGRQMQASDGAERIYHILTPLLLLACVLFSVMASAGQGKPDKLAWCLSATLAAGASFSANLCYGIPWQALCQRLARSGAALAGWDGVTGTGRRASVLLTDTDLFPPGTVSLNGIKIFGDFPVDKVVGITATMIRDAGCGLEKIFHDLLRSQGAVYRRSSEFTCYEGGGVSAVIRGETVLVGRASFMHMMEVALPQGLKVKNAVFCAIDGELAGIFALKYALHGTVEPALNALIRNGIHPVLATRDFNIIPSMLEQRFRLPADRMDFPTVERRVELSDPGQEHSDILTAVLCREGVGPYTEAAVGGKRLRLAVRLSACLACGGAAAGILLAFYLTFAEAYASLAPANLLVFLLMWLVPTVLISNWVNRY
ncbi:hypothetical protein D1159_00855 [Pseudoflavonifractor sp. 524-17]|uniref:hypothetical protein n=1 Tax=Pseudoflavonifractor sp. 524-17 TaxID=2304577 RepID=UPI001379F105|nr:hypothetical protein [Pseudoflavonifractor sp. 524-17]NCE63162.1 hypothetical protein [Pseudoflavonifractor sp. 524-17]